MAGREDGLSDDELRMLSRYFSGECTPAEAAEVARWIDAEPARRAVVETLREAWAAAATVDVPVWDVEAALRRAQRQREGRSGAGRERSMRPPPATLSIDPSEGTRSGVVPLRRTRVAWWRRAAIAAVILVTAVGVAVAPRVYWFGSGQAVREFASAPASRVTVTLRDGTQLVLGPATRLRVPNDFGTSTRTVELDGEALFTVVHDARHPFTVRTARTTVRDVGTTFVVHAYAADRGDRVAVAEGVVALPGVALRANDIASVDSLGRVSVRRGVDVSRYLGWAQGGLVFEDTPLRDAAVELSRTYDLTVNIADSTLATKLVTGSFPPAPVDEVLDAMTRVVGARFQRNGRVVTIRRGVVPAGRSEANGEGGMRMTRADVNR